MRMRNFACAVRETFPPQRREIGKKDEKGRKSGNCSAASGGTTDATMPGKCDKTVLRARAGRGLH